MKNPETELVRGCLRGQAKAQKALYENYKRPLFRICLRYAADRPEAEDLLQDSFITIFRDLHQFNASGNLGAWLGRVTVRTALQHIRKKKKLFPPINIEGLEDQLPSSEDLFSRLNAQALTAMVQQLPAGYRAVFNLYAIEGYSHKEIAEELKITVGTSKSQLSKARAVLRTFIEKNFVS